MSNATKIIAALFAKGYTPVQVVNSLAAKLACVEKVGDAAEIEVYVTTKEIAEIKLSKTYAEAGRGVIPCMTSCENAVVHECKCLCGGVNHGVNVKAA